MRDAFSFTDSSVRSVFDRYLRVYPKADMATQRIDQFIVYKLTGPACSASLTFIVNYENRHFEFAVGRFVSYEGDYVVYPATERFLADLVSSVLEGRIEEKRYGFLWPESRNPARVRAILRFKEHEDYEFARNFNVVSCLALMKRDITYCDYHG